jgi:glucose-1-phosphate cytidylyltransferase
MKVVLFCGGLGTRIRDYSESIPKPVIPIAHQPMLWHIITAITDIEIFILCLGYKADVLKKYFLNFNPPTYGDLAISDFGKKV